MLVWKAIESMTLMISVILRDVAVICPMVPTTCPITSPLSRTVLDASPASWLACRALPAFCCTVAVSSSMLAAVCCSEAACCSVREDNSSLPREMSSTATANEATLLFTSIEIPRTLLRRAS
ncbi:hypothetical protein D9M71_182930 [compost metagenome]